MERLTEHHVNKTMGAYMVCSEACIDEDFDCNNCWKLYEIVDRLAAYEDALPLERAEELAQAEKDGRLLILPDAKYTDSYGEEALREAMWTCGNTNNPVTRYAADAIAEKLCREAEDENPPLTLEELREMDGEPVWCAFPDDSGRYMIIQWHNSEFFKSFECGFLLAEEYGKSWRAYRYKLEGVKT